MSDSVDCACALTMWGFAAAGDGNSSPVYTGIFYPVSCNTMKIICLRNLIAGYMDECPVLLFPL